MALAPTNIKSLARAHTETAIKVLAGIMNQPTAPETARVTAANSLLDRGWGKPTQPIAGDDEAAPIRQRIERVIIDAANRDAESIQAALGAEEVQGS